MIKFYVRVLSIDSVYFFEHYDIVFPLLTGCAEKFDTGTGIWSADMEPHLFEVHPLFEPTKETDSGLKSELQALVNDAEKLMAQLESCRMGAAAGSSRPSIEDALAVAQRQFKVATLIETQLGGKCVTDTPYGQASEIFPQPPIRVVKVALDGQETPSTPVYWAVFSNVLHNEFTKDAVVDIGEVVHVKRRSV